MNSLMNILFLSTGNAARSLIAEALVNGKNSGRYKAYSAGTSPLPSPDPETLDLLASHGHETASLHTKNWHFFAEAPAVQRPDIVVSLSEEAQAVALEKPWPALWVHWAVDAPLSADRKDVRDWKFRKCYSVLDARIGALMRFSPSPSADELLLQFREIGMVV
jgi:protein-tyrosine-phosphatase